MHISDLRFIYTIGTQVDVMINNGMTEMVT